MTIIENAVTLNKPIEEVYAFLADCANHGQLMPESVQDWSATRDEASFSIANMGRLALKVSRREENSKVVIVPAEKAPFDVNIHWSVAADGNNSTRATLRIEAKLNMMMKMLAEKPLQKLVDAQVVKLKDILG
jgi:Uncharacterized conserved protein